MEPLVDTKTYQRVMGNTLKLRSQERVLLPKSENRMEDAPHVLEQIRPEFKSPLTAFVALLSHLSCGPWHPLPAALAGIDRVAEDTNEDGPHGRCSIKANLFPLQNAVGFRS